MRKVLHIFLIISFISTTFFPTLPSKGNQNADYGALALDKSSDVIFAVNEEKDCVDVIDLRTGTVINSILSGKKIVHLGVDEQRGILAAAEGKLLHILSSTSFQTLSSISFEKDLISLGVDSELGLVVATNEENEITIIDLNSYKILKTIKVIDKPVSVAVDTELHLAVIAHNTWGKANDKVRNNVTLIDLLSFSIIKTLQAGKNPAKVAVNSLTHEASVANEKSDDVTVIDLNTQTIKRTISIGKHPLALSYNECLNTLSVIGGEDKGWMQLIDMDTYGLKATYNFEDRRRDLEVHPYLNIAAVSGVGGYNIIPLPNPSPYLSSISPERALRGEGSISLTISGIGFLAGSQVYLNGQRADSTFHCCGSMEVNIPKEYLNFAGEIEIKVINPPPEGGISNSLYLTIENPVPALSSLDPFETVAGAESLTLTLHGTGFFNDTIVYIDDLPRAFSLIDQTKLQIELGAADLEVGTYLHIAATNSPPGGGKSNSLTFTVLNPVPSLSSITPSSVIAGNPSFTLTLMGDNFVKNSVVNFNNQPISSAYISPNKIEANMPSEALATPGSYPVKVKNPIPGGGETSSLEFAVNSPRPPVEPQPEGSFGEKYEDLIPYDATVQSYDPKRFSLITGLVQNLEGSAIANASVSILNYPGYGTAKTNTQGRFSIPVEGGGTLTVVYQKQGLITSHRKVYVPWNDIAIAETIVMIPQDPASTTLTFDGNPNTVITHQSTVFTDDRGSRSSTRVFRGDNRAYSVDASGNVIQELTTLTARATEFVTETSMPAKLPPNSAYTYCVELSVDGFQRVRFEKPVITWVDNFLGFNVGERVPAGYYDRDKGVWVPSDNGVVVRLLDTNGDGIVDALDANGDNQPDDLNSNGSFSDEVAGLADPQRYPPGATFWRVSVSHFTPWDYNLPVGLPSDAIDPNANGNPVPGQQVEKEKGCNLYSSSFVEERTRTFHEDIPVPGTDFTLHYTSSRVNGYYYQITIPASGDTVPSSLKRIIVQMDVAGRTLEQVLNPLPRQKAEFIWDGLDYQGRPVTWATKAHVRVGFVYNGVYWVPGNFGQAFGQPGLRPTNILARQEVISWRRHTIDIGAKVKEMIAEGWTLSSHHYLDPIDPTTLYKGDGTILRNNPYLIETVAGTGLGGYGGDGGPATQARFGIVYGVVADGFGNFYFTDHLRIRKVDKMGIITSVAGGGPDINDGGPATQAYLGNPYGVTVDFMGNLYIADTYNQRIRKVDTSGIITTVAGTGVGGFSGDGGPATQAQIGAPLGVAVDPSGNLYIADWGNGRVRKVDPSGRITTLAQTQIAGIAVDLSGNVYIANNSSHVIRKVDISGVMSIVAGTGVAGYSGDGGPAVQAELYNPRSIAVDASGNLYIADTYNYAVRKVDTSGIITTVAGTGVAGFSGDGGPANQAELNIDFGVSVDPSGDLYIADSFNYRIRKVAPPSVFAHFITGGDVVFVEESGLGHIFGSSGRHKKTIDLETGIVLYEFGYDQNNKLVSITDRFGNITAINRDGNGLPTSITSPDGITTTLTINSSNHLTRISYPDGNFYGFEYTLNGLLRAKIEPEGNRFEHVFDSIGRLTDATDQEGGHWQFSREMDENADVLPRVLTAEGNLTSYRDHTDSTGAFTSHIFDPSGAETTFTSSSDGLSGRKALPCGMVLDFKYSVDSQYQFKYLKEMTETAQSGLKRTTLREKTYQDTNADKIPDLISEKFILNGRTSTRLTNTLQSKRTMTSSLGRTVTTFYNANNLLTNKLTIPGLFDTDFGYDTRGRLTSIKTNIREMAFTYDPQGNLYSITDPEGHTTSYNYDPAGRMTRINRPDNTSVEFIYDKNGNMAVLTNPSSIDHGFGYNKVNLNSSYQTPLSGDYSYLYNRDRRLLQINFPSGKQITNVYDKDRIIEIQTPEGSINLSYLCSSKLGSILKGSESTTYGYDGFLITSETLSGTLNQTLTYAYNNDFNLKSFTYAGGTANYSYDNDGLLTGAGSFTITRNAGNGLPETISGGPVSLTRTFNGFGELDGENFGVNGNALNSWNVSRDKTGRIVSKTETINGITSDYVYAYDSNGRLLTITKDSSLVEEYRYGLNGTRIYEMNALRGVAERIFNYSDEGHLLTAGDTAYQYDLDGFLTTKTSGAGITRYNYSYRGELLNVTLPDGRFIEYINDPMGRRIAKKVDGVIVEKYLWQGLTRLLAVYDGSDNLIMRFEYADSRMPVAMTKGGITYYLTYDQVGSLRLITDASGNVIKKIDYDSFGSIINDTNPGFIVSFGFAGGLHDRDTGLVRFGYRDYDPDTGRWTAKDPIGFAGGDVDLYGYVANNPINWVDPEGELPPVIWGVIVIGVGFVIWAINWWYEVTHPRKLDKCEIKNKEPDNRVPGSPGIPRNFPPYHPPPPPRAPAPTTPTPPGR